MSKGTSKSRFSLGTKKGTSTVEIWDSIDPSLVVQVIQSLAVINVGLTVSTTRDGGAVSLVLLDGNDKHKMYASSGEDLEELLESIRVQADIGAAPQV